MKRRKEKRKVTERKSSRPQPTEEKEPGRERERRPSRNSVSQTGRTKVKAGFTSFPYRDKEVLMADNEFRN